MGEIRKLSKSVSDKIAAGEVVERPLSVVKELIENAIDAGSSAVSISITGGGIKQIVVTDNGKGIAAEDVELAFEKHATSKISTEHDLNYISTQGFRGEALASIAAVSVVDMKTKQRDAELGTHIRVSGSRIDGITPAGLPDGTCVSVENLFFNVPARLKFLKSEQQEAAYVSDLVSRYILAYPEISFHYASNGKTVYHSPGNGELKEAVYCIYGAGLIDNIVFVSFEANAVKAYGYVSRPGAVMKNRQNGSLFVNRRFVRSTALNDMVKSAYGPTLVKGESPFFALNITMPPGNVDVNVHPNKLQVRFADTAAVEYVIKEAVAQGCDEIHGSVMLDMPTIPEKPRGFVEMQAPKEVYQTALFSGFGSISLRESEVIERDNFEPYVYGAALNTETVKDNHQEANVEDISVSKEPVINQPLGFRMIGSFSNTYILVEQGENLLIIDQHAAHERLLYNRFISGSDGASQPLLTPAIITVSHAQKLLIDENMETFSSLGFDIEPFGLLEFKVAAVPAGFLRVPVSTLINDALNEIDENRGREVLQRESIIRAACRSAVKAGDKLSMAELTDLAQSFFITGVIPTCPHGRPVISVITKKQIEKSFKRVL